MADLDIDSGLKSLGEPSDDNFVMWIWSLNTILMSSDVWTTIFARDRDGNRPERTDGIFYRKIERKAAALICRAAGAKNMTLTNPYLDVADAAGMYDAIVNKYSSQTAGTRFKALLKMMSTKKDSEDSWEAVCERIEQALAQVQRLVPHELTVEDVLSEFTLFVLINCIDGNDSTRRTLLGDGSLSWKKAKDTILNQEITSPGQIVASNTSIFAVANSVVEFTDRVQNTKLCFYCEKPGHRIQQCHRYRAAKLAKLHSQRSGSPAQPLPSQANAPTFQPNFRGSRGRGGRSRFRNNGFVANEAVTDEQYSIPTEFAGLASTIRCASSHTSDQWTADSGASISMTPRKDWLHTIISERRAVKLANGAIIWSEGRGVVSFEPVIDGQIAKSIEFHNVLYVPDLSHNLLSTIHLTRHQKFKMMQDDTKMTFYRDKNIAFIATISDRNIAFADGCTIIQSPPAAEASSAVPLKQWHQRLGHCAYTRIKKLLNSDVVRGFDVSNTSIPDETCEDCVMGKLNRAPHTKAAVRATVPLERIFSDVHGPLPTPGRHGERYWTLFVDQCSGMVMVYFLQRKGQVFEAFKQFAAFAENQMNARILKWDEEGIRKVIKALRDDKGGEYSSNQLRDFCLAHGIAREHTIRDTPQQNVLAERMNRTIAEGVTSMICTAKLPPSSWPDAVGAFVYAINRVPSSTSGSKTPFEVWNGHTPSLSMVRTWGCEALVHLQKDQRAPLAPHAR
jgi:transposase InsO family protein